MTPAINGSDDVSTHSESLNSPDRQNAGQDENDQATSAIKEERIYALIAKEFEVGIANKGLWTRLYAECDGDEKKTKVLYIRQRAAALMALRSSTDNSSTPPQPARTELQPGNQQSAASQASISSESYEEEACESPTAAQPGLAKSNDLHWQGIVVSITLLIIVGALSSSPISNTFGAERWKMMIAGYSGNVIGLYGVTAVIGYGLARMRPTITYPGWITVILAWIAAFTFYIPNLERGSTHAKGSTTKPPAHEMSGKPEGFNSGFDPSTAMPVENAWSGNISDQFDAVSNIWSLARRHDARLATPRVHEAITKWQQHYMQSMNANEALYKAVGEMIRLLDGGSGICWPGETVFYKVSPNDPSPQEFVRLDCGH